MEKKIDYKEKTRLWRKNSAMQNKKRKKKFREKIEKCSIDAHGMMDRGARN